MYDPPHLSVWLINQAIHVEVAAIHQGDPRNWCLDSCHDSLSIKTSPSSPFYFTLMRYSCLFYLGSFSSFSFFLWLHFSVWLKTTKDLPVLEAIRLHLMCLPASPRFVGVRRRTLCYISVNRHRWRDASPRAFSAERP